jgi:membrane associated rhomboid family serine protease
MFFILPIGIEDSGKLRPQGLSGTPVTWAVAGVMLLLFVLEKVALLPGATGWLSRAMLSISASWKLYADPNLFEPAQLWTYALLHDGWWHLLGNLIFVVVFGRALESWLGSASYAAALFALAPASALIFLLQPHAGIVNQTLVGASGVISGIMGIAWGLHPRHPVRCVIGYWLIVLIGFLPFRISVRWLLLFFVAQDLLRLHFGNQGVAYEVHLAGVLVGWLIGVALHLLQRSRAQAEK